MSTTRLAFLTVALMAAAACSSCVGGKTAPPSTSDYPVAVDPSKVGQYDALAHSGGGYFYDDVLEYRVWVHPGGDDYYQPFATFEEAQAFSRSTENAEEPLVLVLQRELIDEPKPGQFVHVKEKRITEWQVQWLKGHKRGPDSIAQFLKSKGAAGAQQ